MKSSGIAPSHPYAPPSSQTATAATQVRAKASYDGRHTAVVLRGSRSELRIHACARKRFFLLEDLWMSTILVLVEGMKGRWSKDGFKDL